MKKSTRLKIGFYGLVLIIVGSIIAINYQFQVKGDTVVEIDRVENSAASKSYWWNVSGYFEKGDVVCGLLLPPIYQVPGWLQMLEPHGSYAPYGMIPFSHVFVDCSLFDSSGETVSTVEIVWANDPNGKPPINEQLLVYDMTYLVQGKEDQYSPVMQVSPWFELVPRGVDFSGNYTLKISAYGATAMPVDQPPFVIALGKRSIVHPYLFFLPLGSVIIAGGVFLVVVAAIPMIVTRPRYSPKRNSKH